MTHKYLFLWIALALLAGAIVQKIYWGGSFSVGLIVMAAASAWCSHRAKE